MARRIFLTFSLAFCLMAAATASACDSQGGYGFGLGYMYGSLDYRVPYFAAHPPVYYSQPVPRTYGHSPFAYPAHFRTPEVVENVQPLQITNPYVPSSIKTPAKEAERTTDARTPQPLVVENPYVKQPLVLPASRKI